MIARRLIQALVFLHPAAWCGAAVLTPPEIPEQPLIRTIYEWGNQVAVITEPYQGAENTPGSQLYVVDPSRLAVVPVRVPACDTYHDVAHDPRTGKWLLCGTASSTRVYKGAGESWAAASEAMQGGGFRFAVDGDRVAVVSEQSIYLISPASIGRPARSALGIRTRGGQELSALLLTGQVLLLALDLGEFGGGLYRVDLGQGGKPPTRLIKDNVATLARTKSGEIWAAAGLSHLGGVSAALYRIIGDRVEIVAAIEGYQGLRAEGKVTQQSGVPFPALTSLAGLSLRREERPAVVFPQLGVYELAGDRFARLYEGSLSFGYRMPTHSVGSHPVGLAIDPSGHLYVASRSLGIFVLRKAGDRYGLKQLRIDDAERSAPSKPTR